MRNIKTKKFIIVSIIIHIFFVLAIGKEAIKEKKLFNPLKIKILEEFSKTKGIIEDLPKPPMIEEPKEAKILSRYSSKAHQDLSDKKSDIPGVKKPSGLTRKKASEIASKKSQKSEIKALIKDKRISPESESKKILAKLERRKELESLRSKEKIVKKEELEKEALLRKKEKLLPDTLSPQREDTRSLKGLPLLSSEDLKKYLKPGSEGEGSDGFTVSLDTKEYKFVSYFIHIKNKIELVWDYPMEAAMEGIYGSLFLKFTILSNGELEKVVLIKSSGSTILDDEAISAVKTASPYNTFPKRIIESRITITATFHYLPRILYVR